MENGAIRLFKAWGIQVSLHWTWFLIAAYELNFRRGLYSSPIFNFLEFIALFGIVLIHEFGHSLACRQVGGEARRIILWPFGGIAFVNPPPRPGALLWSIAAGPLVNVALVPVLFGLSLLVREAGILDAWLFVRSLQLINFILLVFNLMPIYPLDGGQLLRALLWFAVGRHKSLTIASIVGMIGGAGVIALAIYAQSWWLGFIAIFMISQCVRGFKEGRILSRIAAAPRHGNFQCPNCHTAPIEGAFWKCGRCGAAMDLFQSGGQCHQCEAEYAAISCPECHRESPLADWQRA